jgi:hypothetical protein
MKIAAKQATFRNLIIIVFPYFLNMQADQILQFAFFFRMHLNDLENMTPFFFLGLAYAMSNPDHNEAKIVFGVSRKFV